MRGLGYHPLDQLLLFSSPYNVQIPTLFPQAEFHTNPLFFVNRLADFYNSEARA